MKCLIIHPNNRWEIDMCDEYGNVNNNYISTYYVFDTVFPEYEIIEDDTMYYHHLNYAAGIFVDEFVFGGTVGLKRKDNQDITTDDIRKLLCYYNNEKYKPKHWIVFMYEKLPHWLTHPIHAITTLYGDIKWRYKQTHENKNIR